MGVDAVAQEPGLIQHLRPLEHLHGVIGVDRLLLNGQRLGSYVPHTGFHTVQQRLAQGEAAPCPDEQGVADGILHGNSFYVFLARDIKEGFQHQEDRTALIGLHTWLFFRRDHLQRTVPVQRFVQLAELSVPVDQQNVVGKVLLKIGGDSPERCSEGIGVLSTVHGDLDHGSAFHQMIPPACFCRVFFSFFSLYQLT